MSIIFNPGGDDRVQLMIVQDPMLDAGSVLLLYQECQDDILKVILDASSRVYWKRDLRRVLEPFKLNGE